MARSHRDAETRRLEEDARRQQDWRRWGPYLSERQWGTVREDYSPDGNPWEYFPHDHARSRAYRWGEDGLLGICDRGARLCFAIALWNGRDPILKERLFGLTNAEGNHGEDVKEYYFYLDSTPTHSYMRALYKYPQRPFPYAHLREANRGRGKGEPEFELVDTGIFEGNRYFDIGVEYAKASPNDLLIRLTAVNRGPQEAGLHLLPTLWFRNTWSWGRTGEGYWPKPRIERAGGDLFVADHPSLGRFRLALAAGPDGEGPELLVTENETNMARLFGQPNPSPWVKDAFHDCVVLGRSEAVNPHGVGTRAAARYVADVEPGGVVRLRLRLSSEAEGPKQPFGAGFEQVFARRIREAEAFYKGRLPQGMSAEERSIVRQAYAGLLWTKQFYHYVVKDWVAGDPAHPPPPASRGRGRNADWAHLYNRDVISMPDKWEFPWYAAWDLAFHAIPLAEIDPEFAKGQLLLFLREWYMHPNGQLPAYEFALSDVNPPVHAWACWRIYKITGRRGRRDRLFLARSFQKLLLNFTWWVNRKDLLGKHLFAGGFLGLDNIGVFDRSKPLPGGGTLEQADGTAWMAFFCSEMLSMALELAREDPAYEDIASKFFEHFVAIADAINTLDGTGLWDEGDGFYYDHLHVDGRYVPMRVRSMVGLIPLVAVEVLEEDTIERLPGFGKRMRWFLENRQDLARHISYLEREKHLRLLAIPSRRRLERMLRYLVDEEEFLSPYGIRSLSRAHRDRPFVCHLQGQEYRIAYVPGESDSELFGGNSNWRGPIWFPVNYLLIEALERYHRFYGDSLQVEVPTGSGRRMNLAQVANEIALRLTRIFLRDAEGRRPWEGEVRLFRDDPHWRDLVFFHEYFHGETGQGLGAGHQTGWTALAARLIKDHARSRHPGLPRDR
jgi:hypothetical protein